jgi:TPR repeat protein
MPSNNIKFLRQLFRHSLVEVTISDLETAYFLLLESPSLLKAVLNPLAISAEEDEPSLLQLPDDEIEIPVNIPSPYSPWYHRTLFLIILFAGWINLPFGKTEYDVDISVRICFASWVAMEFIECINALYQQDKLVKKISQQQSQQARKVVERVDLPPIKLDSFVEILRRLTISSEDIGVVAKSFLLLLACYPKEMVGVSLSPGEKGNLRQDIERAANDRNASPLVQTLLATIYHYFIKDPSLREATFNWYQKAASRIIPDQEINGFIPAKYLLIRFNLQFCTLSNEGYSIIERIAYEPYKYAFSQALLGNYYDERSKENSVLSQLSDYRAQAQTWYRRAAEKLHPHALFKLGQMNNDAEVKEGYLFGAAVQGHRGAQYELGLFYSQDNPSRNLIKAVRWLETAMDFGHPEARKALQLLLDVNPDLQPAHANSLPVTSGDAGAEQFKLSGFRSSFLANGFESNPRHKTTSPVLPPTSLHNAAPTTSEERRADLPLADASKVEPSNALSTSTCAP